MRVLKTMMDGELIIADSMYSYAELVEILQQHGTYEIKDKLRGFERGQY